MPNPLGTDLRVSCTVPIFALDEGKRPCLRGTAIFIEDSVGRYLLTARHVVEDDSAGIFLPSGTGLVGLKATIVYPRVDMPHGYTEPVDIAIICYIRAPALNHDLGFQPLVLGRQARIRSANVGTSCSVVGFPASRTRRNSLTKQVASTPLSINTTVLSLNNSVAFRRFKVQFTRDRKGAIGRRFAPEPFGMSGCGIWNNDSETAVDLIGIAVEYQKAPANAIECISIEDLFISGNIPLSALSGSARPIT
jgi:hypothetical protein